MNTQPTSIAQENYDYRELLKPYTKHWKWFVVSVLLFVILGFLYIRYAVPRYAIEAKIEILEDESGSSQLNVFEDLNVFGPAGSPVSDEIEVLNSRSNIGNVVKKLGLNVRIIAMGNIKNTDVYKNPSPPFNINFIAPDSVINNATEDFFITLINDTTFDFAETEDGPSKKYSFGNTISSSLGDMIITPNLTNPPPFNSKDYAVVVQPVLTVAGLYQERVIIEAGADNSRILTISLEDPLVQRAEDFVNTLITNYNQNAIEDKKEIADRTSNFIDERITNISDNLSSADQSAVDFKSGRGLTDIATQNNLNLNIGAESRQQLQNARIQLDIASSMRDIINNDTGYELLPANVGLEEAAIASTTARYNELALERKRLLESSNEKNPTIVNLDRQLAGLKRSMSSSLNSVTNNLELQVNSLSSRLSSINSSIYSAPKNERALRDIARKQETTESLYLYLLQKREEAQIAFASSSAKSKIIDSAYPISPDPVSPKKPLILLAALVLGLLIPYGFIYIGELLDNKVRNKVGLEKIIGDRIVLAELPKISKKNNRLIKLGERSVLAESLRILRTNLDYMVKAIRKRENKAATICVTSSVSGEGKTLVSCNLAMVIANTNKKVLLIGADIRNPNIHQFYSGDNVDKLGRGTRNKEDIGLTEYLIDQTLESKDIISTMLAHEQVVDVIYSGKIPPNPAELLMNGRLKELLESIEDLYDYIIIDTAPLMVVTDTLIISEHADQIIYVTRAGMTNLKVLEYPLKLNSEGKLQGLSFIVNGVKDTNLGYGGKYGYGYTKKVKKWWKI